MVFGEKVLLLQNKVPKNVVSPYFKFFISGVTNFLIENSKVIFLYIFT